MAWLSHGAFREARWGLRLDYRVMARPSKDLSGPRFRTVAQDSPAELARAPMHNPFGRLKLVSLRDIAETN